MADHGLGTLGARLERIARRVRLLIPSTSGDVRAELEEVRAEIESVIGPSAEVIGLDAEARKRGKR